MGHIRPRPDGTPAPDGDHPSVPSCSTRWAGDERLSRRSAPDRRGSMILSLTRCPAGPNASAPPPDDRETSVPNVAKRGEAWDLSLGSWLVLSQGGLLARLCGVVATALS